MTTVAVLQPGFLPWLGFFDQMLRADYFIYYDDVQFDKHGWRNRNRIKTPNGPAWLTVPVHHHGHPLITDITIDNSKSWARKLLGTLRQYYCNTPYFDQYFPLINNILEQSWEKLIDLDIALVECIRDWLDISTPIQRTSQLQASGDRSLRLINICSELGATHYLSGNAARDYLDVESFIHHGIHVVWQDYLHPVYRQQYGEFLPYLSIMDLILNEGPNSRFILDGAIKESGQ